VDWIFVEGLELEGRHGHFRQERQQGNRFRFDVRVQFDTHRAGRTDLLANTLDYTRIVEAVRGQVSGQSVKLVETLAEHVAAAIFRALPAANTIQMKVAKLNPPTEVPAVSAGVEILRRR
jgi:dihydroneopterin aldolase